MDIMRPHMRGWMGVLLLRRAALVFCLLLGQRGGGIVHVPYFGTEIGWLGPPFFILLICVGAQGYCQPFATANDNVLEMFGLLTLLTFVFSDTFFVGKRPPCMFTQERVSTLRAQRGGARAESGRSRRFQWSRPGPVWCVPTSSRLRRLSAPCIVAGTGLNAFITVFGMLTVLLLAGVQSLIRIRSMHAKTGVGLSFQMLAQSVTRQAGRRCLVIRETVTRTPSHTQRHEPYCV